MFFLCRSAYFVLKQLAQSLFSKILCYQVQLNSIANAQEKVILLFCIFSY